MSSKENDFSISILSILESEIEQQATDLRVSVEYPGYLAIGKEDLGATFDFGTANGAWEGDIIDLSGVNVGVLSTGLPSSCLDAHEIAKAIINAVRQFERNREQKETARNKLYALISKYTLWCKDQGLKDDDQSADDLIFSKDLTDAQRDWLSGFIMEWDDTEQELIQLARLFRARR